MLTITFDPTRPQSAIEEARNLVAMLGDYLTSPRSEECPANALAGAQDVFFAVTATMLRAVETINTAMGNDEGWVQPMRPRMFAASAQPVPEDAVALVGGMVAAARAEAKGVPTHAESIATLAAHLGTSEADAKKLIDDALLRRADMAGEAAHRARTAVATQSLIDTTKRRAAKAPSLTEPRPATGKRRRAA